MTSTDVLHLGVSAEVTFQRVGRATPDAPPPRAVGTYPLRWVDRYEGQVPPGWRDMSGLIAPVGEHEAAWLSFRADEPVALLVVIDGLNAVTGEAAAESGFSPERQSYVVLPGQRWLDGVRSEAGLAEQITGPSPAGDAYKAVRLVARRLRGASFRRWWVESGQDRRQNRFGEPVQVSGGGDASGAGLGVVLQEIVPDPFQPGDWDPDPVFEVVVHLVEPARWAQITGEPAPPAV